MVNFFKVKKWATMIMPGAFATMVLVLLLFLNLDVIIAIIAGFATLLVLAFLGTIFLQHPMLSYIEGKGYNVWDLNSTGSIQNFLVSPNLPMVAGKYRGQAVERLFDRANLFYMSNPKTAAIKEIPEGKLLFLPKEEESKTKFMANDHPTFIWNSNINSFLTKEYLSTMETNSFIRHIVLDLLKKQEDIRFNLRDFVRYVVNSLRPKLGIFENNPWIIWVIVIMVLGAALYALWPSLSGAFGGAIDSGASAVGSAAANGVITPK